eukprot:2182626-Rhodomonas_salina.3
MSLDDENYDVTVVQCSVVRVDDSEHASASAICQLPHHAMPGTDLTCGRWELASSCTSGRMASMFVRSLQVIFSTYFTARYGVPVLTEHMELQADPQTLPIFAQLPSDRPYFLVQSSHGTEKSLAQTN